jgi:hypothetical protein
MIRSHDAEQNLADTVSYVAITPAKRQKLNTGYGAALLGSQQANFVHYPPRRTKLSG